jgi:uncharacterized protein
MAPMTLQRANRLLRESSPYLLQHSHNPVDWYPWGHEALRIARERDQPILLSVGYSSCHWCHVMERESFEDEETARLMNDHFVSIKVDREERPDVDAIYMNFVQMTTGHGGWPLTVFLTPDLVPFYGGTYFPPHDLPGRPGFRSVLRNVAAFYRERREEVLRNRDRLKEALESSPYLTEGDDDLGEETLNSARDALMRNADLRNGGFGGAPKFPSSVSLGFLMRWCNRKGDPSAREVVERSLDAMARGGIYDQLGGGFHRYAVDARWMVPHFEKMLYDNALLARAYLEGYQMTGREEYRSVVQETLGYVLRDLGHPSGGFFAAEDADSEGEEGKFYVWTAEEISTALDRETTELFGDFFGVTTPGNWEGRNILHRRRDVETMARERNISQEDLLRVLDGARSRLLEVRGRRTRPGLDDKVLASWNGLMLSAFAEASFVFARDDYLRIARRSAEFLVAEMIREGRLRRSWKDGEARLQGYLEDYAHVVEGFLALFRVSGERVWLDRAVELTEVLIQYFWDEASGDFFFTPSDHEPLLIRPKEHFDNATPSGNSTSAHNLLKLARLTGTDRYREMAERMLRRMSAALSRFPHGFGNWLRAVDDYLGPVKEVAVVGSPEARQPFLDVLRSVYLPRMLMVVGEGNEADTDPIPLLRGRSAPRGSAVAYVCESYVCSEPAAEPALLADQIGCTS